MGWMQAGTVMPIRQADVFQRLAAGIVVLGLLLLGNVHPASAHGTGRHQTVSKTAGQLVIAGHHRCNGCPGCCAMRKCSVASVALPGSPTVMEWLTRQSAIYEGYTAREAARLGAAPAIPPPRSDA